MIPITFDIDRPFFRNLEQERTFETMTVMFQTKDKQYHLQNVYDLRLKGKGSTIDIVPSVIEKQGMKFYPVKYLNSYYDLCFKPFTEQQLMIIESGHFGDTNG